MKENMEYYKKDEYKNKIEYPVIMNSIRKNIVNWYDFKENSDILEIGSNCEEITEYLCSISKSVTTIEFSEEKMIEKNSNKDNLKIIAKNLEEIKLEEKFDYIIMIGTLEYADSIMKDKKDPYNSLLQYCVEKLKPDGTLLIAVDNRLGVKYISGGKSYHCEKIYDSIKNNFSNGKLFSKKELEELIEKSKIKNKRYYYPLPDYKMPNVIISEEYLLDASDSKVNYNFVYEEGSLVVQDEIKLLKQFIKNGEFNEYTNSYIVELSNSDIKNDIKYVSFNNIRKEEYSLILKINGDTVQKYPKEEISKKHVKNIIKNTEKLKKLGFKVAEETNNEEYIKSKYIKFMQLDKYIIKLLENNQTQEAYDIIDKWYKYIGEMLKPNKDGIVENGFIDLVFENFFYDEKSDTFIAFDQEWIEKNINIKYILYRAIENICAHNHNVEKMLDKDKILKKYRIEDKEEYSKLENEFQEKILDKEKKNFYGEQYKYKISPEELIKIIKDVKKLDRDNIELIGEINRLNNQIQKNTIFAKIKRKFNKN